MKSRFWTWAVTLFMLIIGLLLIGGVFALQRIHVSVWTQTVNDVLEVTAQGAHAFEVYTEQGLFVLKGWSYNFSGCNSQDAQDIGGKLDLYEGGDPSFVVIDIAGGNMYYNSTHSDTLPEETARIYRKLTGSGLFEPFISEYTGQQVVGYYECFDFADGSPGLIRKVVPTREIAEEFSLSFFDGEGFSYIVNAAGDILLNASGTDDGTAVSNVFEVVSLNAPEDIAAFRASLSSGERGAMRLNYDGEDHILAFVPLKWTEGWYLISIVPDRVLTENTNEILENSRVVLIGIVALIFSCVAFFTVVGWSRYRMKEQRTQVLYWEQLFNLLSGSSNDVFMILSGDGNRVEYVSPNVERITGVSREDAAKDVASLQSVLHSDGRGFDIDAMMSIPQGESVSYEGWCVHRREGERRWYIETIYHTVIHSSERFIIVQSDRTEDRQKEAALTEAMEIAKAANQSKSAFLANMSHDIRTPMNAIVGFATLIERDAADSQKVREHVAKIKSSSHHMLELINNVLDMSKIESGKTTLNMGVFSMSELIEGLSTIIRTQAKVKNQSFEVNVGELCSETFMGDKLRLNQIFINLLSNAIKYTPEGGHISMSAEQFSSARPGMAGLRFVVADDGIGMSEEYIKQIFKPFTREERAGSEEIRGTGLGMAITKSLVELMGGTISVQSEIGKGSVFTIEMSLSLPEGETVIPREREEQKAPQDVGERLKGKHFLCAEDNELNMEIIGELLSMEGATCEVCPNGKATVERFERSENGEFDAVLMDIQMPVMDGYEATRAIRALNHPQAAGIPIVAMTANAFTEDIRRVLDAGMNAHIAKPIDIDALARVLWEIWADKE